MNQFLFLIFLIPLVSPAQPKTKQVFVDGDGQPIVLLHGGTFDITSFGPHSTLLADSFKIIRLQQFNVQYASEGRRLPRLIQIQQKKVFC